MVLTEKEKAAILDLQTQEKACFTKYTRYAKEAKDPVLQELLTAISTEEQNHYNSLGKVLKGTVPRCNCNDNKGASYKPKACYTTKTKAADKENDSFLVTDCIASEKLTSSEYNSDVFVFGDSKIRKLLADIQIEEQNHAEMLWKYKTVNNMQ